MTVQEIDQNKQLQAALEKDKNVEQGVVGEIQEEEVLQVEDLGIGSESCKQLASQMNELIVSVNANIITPPLEATEGSNSGSPIQEINKRIRALKKEDSTCRKTTIENCTRYEARTIGQIDKAGRLHKELKLLEDKKVEMATS
ncbi:uncharacterized protein LOC121247321 [Juglans microcarpa x Juglans regia]|uniref:uncharacterized protein LOC121247321 n=1 Tax=Juglans microcarpa x Juglans regia TaxID=2249226 RepID=UPI001B7F33B6|nr:uncharacterized protein LOC121247321 [Juglans microcarpa x Juglans regia]